MVGSIAGVRWLWAVGSGLALMLGGVVAVTVYPQAGFARNPTGTFGWHLVGFAAIVAATLALAQWLLVTALLRRRCAALVAWIPLTMGGVIALMLPLWWYDASLFMFMPWAVLLATLPGFALLAVLQNLVLRAAVGAGWRWSLFTLLGGVIGSVAGLLGALMLQPAPIEATWALFMGMSIGYFQGVVLDDLRADLL